MFVIIIVSSLVITPANLLPSVNQTGDLVAVEQIFANHQLEVRELWQIQNTAQYLQGLMGAFGAINYSRENLPENEPWLDEWAKQMDTWVEDHGLLLPVPIEKEGELEIIIKVDNGSPDHMDTWKHMPIGLSIGLQGRRELVGVAFDEIDEVFEAKEKLKKDGRRLSDLDEFEGRTVQRVVQEVGDVTQIAGFATLHSGEPLEAKTADGERLVNAVAIIGYKSVAAAGYELVARAHMERYYRPVLQTLGDLITDSVNYTNVF
jgi:hypothetical protein